MNKMWPLLECESAVDIVLSVMEQAEILSSEFFLCALDIFEINLSKMFPVM